MLSSPKGEVRQICHSAFSVLKICTLIGLQYFACSALDDRVITFKEPRLNKALEGHAIISRNVPNEGSCRVNCYLNPDCVSINMGPLTEGMLTCEMNNATSGDIITALENKAGYTYLEIENPCSSSPCLNGGTCQAGFTSKGFRCQCINSSFANHRCEIAKSCSHLKKLRPEAISGTYLIDPDGRGTLAPFIVTCNMTDKEGIGVTVISHNSEDRKFVNGCKDPGCYSRDIHYVGVNLSQLASLTKVSSHCEQFIKYECFHSRLRFKRKNEKDPFGWWVSRDSNQMTYWGGALPGSNNCACGMKDSCQKRKNNSTFKCNCDNNDAEWREDSGLLTDKSTLPVTQLRFGDVGFSKSNRHDERGYHTLGKLKCYMDSTFVSPQTGGMKSNDPIWGT